MNKNTGIFSLTMLSLLLFFSSPALALDNAPPGKKSDRDKLEDAGYKCKLLSPGYVECTKSGKTKQWCDSSGECEEVAREVHPIPPRTTTTTPVLTRPEADIFW